MHKILMINEEKVALGDENNNLVTVPRTAISYENPAVGDSVDLFQNDSVSIVVKAENDNEYSSKSSKVHLRRRSWLPRKMNQQR